MRFQDRVSAGIQLADALKEYADMKNCCVIGLPRGGVIVAAEIARKLSLPLDILAPRKVGAPHNPELALGAVTYLGKGFFNSDLIDELGVTKEYLDAEIKREQQVSQYRTNLYRSGRPPLNLTGKTVIIADDGLATGATMKAAILCVREQKAKKIVAAVPVSPPDTAREVAALADELVVIATPAAFYAVGQFYDNFGEVTDTDVTRALAEFASKEQGRT